MRQRTRKIMLLQLQTHCLVMQAILVQMTRGIRKKKEGGIGVVVQAEVKAKVVAGVEVEVEVTVVADQKAAGRVQAIGISSKM